MIEIGLISSAARASRSISTVRMRASDHDFMGGLKGIVWDFPSTDSIVRASKVMSRARGFDAALADSSL